MYFEPIPIPTDPNTDPVKQLRLHRLNCLGSLFYFIRTALRRDGLTHTFHLPLCRSLECEHLKKVFEWPRDHYKSTIASEGYPMWRALPLSHRDVDEFYQYGFSEEWIRWMLKMHDPTKRNLLVSENVTNAAKLGTRIRRHFESNAIFRTLFPEILPTPREKWTDFSLSIRQPEGVPPHGEGTFDFIGVGGAAQSRHYNGLIIQDDLVGRKAIESISIMEKTIDYHRLVSALYEHNDATHDGDEIVIGNRWGYHDLNSYIREHEDWFSFETHSAYGGCCADHPADTIVFPEKFNEQKLEKLRRRFGAYSFSCQFLNNPSAPENADFHERDINWFKFVQAHDDGSVIIQHETKDGIIRKDLPFRRLQLAMAADPTHTATGRCRHAIVVMGQSPEGNYYLVDTWAESCSHEKFFNKLYEIAEKWRVRNVGFETCAGQSLALPHLKFLNTIKPWQIRMTELKGEVEGPDGDVTTKKEWRIRNILGPIFEFGRFFMQRKHQDFLGEFTTFPRGRYCDQLDALAYVPQLLRTPMRPEIQAALLKQNKMQARMIATPYSSGYRRYN